MNAQPRAAAAGFAVARLKVDAQAVVVAVVVNSAPAAAAAVEIVRTPVQAVRGRRQLAAEALRSRCSAAARAVVGNAVLVDWVPAFAGMTVGTQ